MLRRREIPGLIDVIEVNDAKQIQDLARDPKLDREFVTRTCPVNHLLLSRSLKALSFNDRRFPTMTPRDNPERAQRQQELWQRLTAQADEIRRGPEELERLAAWVKGAGADDEVGLLAQQLLGRLFSQDVVATEASWNAAKILVAAPRMNNMPKLLWWSWSGKISRAKRLLAGMVGDDLSAVNAIGIAVHNVVKSLRHMRVLYADRTNGRMLSAHDAVEQSLFAPLSVFRQAKADGQAGGCPFSKHSLFILEIGEACRQPGGRSLVFMDDTWSACPANAWVPAMLEGVWNRACR